MVNDIYPDKDYAYQMLKYSSDNMHKRTDTWGLDKLKVDQALLTPRLRFPQTTPLDIARLNSQLTNDNLTFKFIRNHMDQYRINYVLLDFIDTQPDLTSYLIMSNLNVNLIVKNAFLDNDDYTELLTTFITRNNVLLLIDPFYDLVLWPGVMDENLNEIKGSSDAVKREMEVTTKYLYVVYQYVQESYEDTALIAVCLELQNHKTNMIIYDKNLQMNGSSIKKLAELNKGYNNMIVGIWVDGTDIGIAGIEYLNENRLGEAVNIDKMTNYDLKAFSYTGSWPNPKTYTKDYYIGNLVIAFCDKVTKKVTTKSLDDTDQEIKSKDDRYIKLQYRNVGTPYAMRYYSKRLKKVKGELLGNRNHI